MQSASRSATSKAGSVDVPHKNIVLLLLAFAQLLVILDGSIINVALPAINESLAFEPASLQWVVTAYLLTFGGFLMLGGRLADLFGRRLVLLSGMIGFVLCSLLLGLTDSSVAFIVLRALQGLAAACMAPAALSILLATFHAGHERNKALGIWSLVGSSGAALGLLFGGVLTQYWDWEWNFFINVPIGIVAVAAILKYIPRHLNEEKQKRLDAPGAVLVTSGLITLVYALTQTAEATWAIVSFAASMLLLGGFLLREKYAKHPLVPLKIFRVRNVTGGTIAMLFVVAAGMGQFFFSTLYLQNILHYSPLMTGLSFLPIPITIGVMAIRVPRLIHRFGHKPLMVAGTLTIAAAAYLLSLLGASSSYIGHLLPTLILVGLGLGLSLVSTTAVVASALPAREAGLAAGFINTSQQIGGALGVASLTTVASIATAGYFSRGYAVAEASLYGYQQAYIGVAACALLALLVTVFVIRDQAPETTAKR